MPQKPARCYTHQHRPPYTRREYIHGIPPPKITKFVMGNTKLATEVVTVLRAEERGVIRHNALEAARVIIHKFLSTEVGEQNFLLIIKKYPHQVLREHKMMAFAGADRLQEGMRRAFGKPVGLAAIVEPLDEIIEIRGLTQHIELLKEGLRRAAAKLPIKCSIEIRKLK
uniref:Large ribosomal subunit protein uL16 n=1 Tax=Ignisphaera aggregans TaxID=334771 RepID=A0A7J2U147_9CREN